MTEDVLNPTCQKCPIRFVGPCKHSHTDELNKLGTLALTSSYPPGTSIVNQGAQLNHVGLVKSGTVIVSYTTLDGHRLVVDLLRKGGLIGESEEAEARFAYEAASAVSVCFIPRSHFLQIASTHASVAFGAWETTRNHSRAILDWLVLLNCGTTFQRLATYLAALAIHLHSGADARTIELQLPLGRQDLAAYLATTPETLSRNFQDLARRNIIKVNGGQKVEILNVEALNRIAADCFESSHSLAHDEWNSTEDSA